MVVSTGVPVTLGLLATSLGLLPALLVLGTRAPEAHRWLSLAFAISVLADLAALAAGPFWVSRVYLVSQAVLVAAVFVSRREALFYLALLTAAGLAGLAIPVHGPELFTHAVAWGSICLIVHKCAPEPLRRALLAYFGLGLAAWLGYASTHLAGFWFAYQGTRALGILLFGYACWKPAPELRLT